MDVNKRFDQLESFLVDLARKQDQLLTIVSQQGEVIRQQSEAIRKQSEAIGQQGEAIGQQGVVIGRIERRLDNIDEQIGDIINIFKISEARHTQTEQRQEAMLTEIREHGRAIIEQGVALKEHGRRLDDTLNVQLQMLQLMRAGNDKADDLARRLAPLEDQEPRLKRLEDEVFRAAS
ncbi:hypothetical protein [Hymenobacter sp. BRD67]|uniref:hypothetical protein n=1 Tax=Hymenobacter sp. BRD67 TaxID=2675877 RepID=UPI0015671857|nr:hypothetical protein [Hymenobacter sp. BRD67]QKG54309.1 hypothetical protein GKZ67_19035 [Hymenobacter sp. BRD67]